MGNWEKSGGGLVGNGSELVAYQDIAGLGAESHFLNGCWSLRCWRYLGSTLSLRIPRLVRARNSMPAFMEFQLDSM